MTLDRYADLFDDDLHDVADRLDALRTASRGPVAVFGGLGPRQRACLSPQWGRDPRSGRWRRGESNP